MAMSMLESLYIIPMAEVHSQDGIAGIKVIQSIDILPQLALQTLYQ